MIRPIHNRELHEMLDRREVYYCNEPAHHKHSINGLSRLVTRQRSGQQADPGAAYIFGVSGNGHVKILLPAAERCRMMEIQGDQAREVLRICTLSPVP